MQITWLKAEAAYRMKLQISQIQKRNQTHSNLELHKLFYRSTIFWNPQPMKWKELWKKALLKRISYKKINSQIKSLVLAIAWTHRKKNEARIKQGWRMSTVLRSQVHEMMKTKHYLGIVIIKVIWMPPKDLPVIWSRSRTNWMRTSKKQV